MAQKHEMSKGEETFYAWVGGIVLVLIPIAWLFDWGPFGWFDDPPEPSDPKYLVATDGFGCITEDNALRLEDALARRDGPKMDLLMKNGQCFNTVPSYVPLKFESGTFSTSVRRVSWPATQGKRAGSGYIGPSSVQYMTGTELDKQWEIWGPICEEYNPGDCDTGR